MADIISRLKLESGEFDSKIKRAGQELLAYSEHCKKAGLQMGYANKDAKKFANALGSMQTTSNTARGKINELSDAFVNLKVMYKQMTDEEKKGEFGKALNASLNQLKTRIDAAKKDLADVTKELGGTQTQSVDLSNVMQTLGSKFGISSDAMGLLTTGTVGYTAAIGGLTTAVIAGTKAWADYNEELTRQSQITTVTTGLKGTDADRMADAAKSVADVYGTDFREVINAANTLMTQFGKSGNEAMQLIRDGMQGMIQGDGPKLLSMIQQYAPAFRDAGVSASQLVAVIQNSEGGIFTDQNMNAIVMGIKNIRLMTKATSDALAQLGIDGQKMSKDLSEGTITIFDALKQVATQIQGVNSNSQAAGEVMQQVFGRQGAMAGTKLGEAIATLNINLEETKRQTGDAGQAYADLQGATERLNGAIRETFGYDGYEVMATGIKTKLYTAMADVLDLSLKIKDSWVGGVGRTIFDTMTDAALKVSGPLGTVLSLLRNINSERGKGNGGNNGSIGTGDIDKTLQYIGNGANQQERETRYDKAIAQLRQKLDNIGKERRVNNADGSVSYKIDSQDVQDQKRAALERRISILEKQRNNVVNKSDTSPIEPVKPLHPIKPTKTTSSTTPAQRAAENIKTAEQEYARSLEKAALEVQDGTITEAQQKQKQLQATEALWTAYGKASDMVNGSNADYKAKQAELGQRIVALGGEVKVATEAQEAAKKAARELEAAQKKQAEAVRNLRQAEASGNYGDIVKARNNVTKTTEEVSRLQTVTVSVKGTEALEKLKSLEGVKDVKVNVEPGNIDMPAIPTDGDVTTRVNVEPGNIDMPAIPTDGDVTTRVNVEPGNIDMPAIPTDGDVTVTLQVDDAEALEKLAALQGVSVTVPVKVEEPKVKPIPVPLTTANLDAFKKHLQEEMATTNLGDPVMKSLEEQMSDATALSTIFGTAIQNGIDTSQFDTSGLMQRILNKEDISDTEIQGYIETLNEQLKAVVDETEWPKIALTFDVNTKEITAIAKQQQKDAHAMAKDWQAAGSAIQAVGSAMSQIEDPAAKVMGTIAQAIGSVALGYAQATVQAASMGPWAWIAFAATGLATMISTISAIHSATGYANGGVVKGSSYSGDNIPALVDGSELVGLNAGEIVLNAAQQSNVAQGLQGTGMQNLRLSTEIDAESIKIILNNNGERTGNGEYIKATLG